MIPAPPENQGPDAGLSSAENQELMGLLTPRLIELLTKAEPDMGRLVLEYRQGFADPFDDAGQTPTALPPEMPDHGVMQPFAGPPPMPPQPPVGQSPVARPLPGGPVPPPPAGLPAPTGLNRFNFKR